MKMILLFHGSFWYGCYGRLYSYTLIIGVMFWYVGLTKVIKSDYGLMCKISKISLIKWYLITILYKVIFYIVIVFY